jgi:hypothetical protein
MVRKFFKMLPSNSGFLEGNQLLTIIETKNVYRFLPDGKNPGGLTTRITLLCEGRWAGILRLKTELHQKFLFEVTVTKLLDALRHFPTRVLTNVDISIDAF